MGVLAAELAIILLYSTAPAAAGATASDSAASKIICKNEKRTETRIVTARVCRTRAEWTHLEEETRRRLTVELDREHSANVMKNNPRIPGDR